MYNGPFKSWGRPAPEDCREVTRRLTQLHGRPPRAADPLAASSGCAGQMMVLDSLVRTLLSQNTTDTTSLRAFTTLKERFPTWDSVLAAPAADLEDAIRVGGLAAIKVQRMQAILQSLKRERGACCLEWLRQEPSDAVKAFLSQYKGIGPKTVSCVMMFCLDRSEFPVDTHVLFIARALGWCPASCTREQAYEHLNCTVPDDVKFDLHVLLVTHGKLCAACGKTGRGAGGCPLADLKRKGGGTAKASSAVAEVPALPPKLVEVKAERSGVEVKEEAGEGRGTGGAAPVKREEQHAAGPVRHTKRAKH